jgi:hypothetical protein
MRQLYTMATGGFTDPRKYDDTYANANYDKLTANLNQLFNDAMTNSYNAYTASGYGNGIGSLGALSSIRAPYAAEAARGQASLWNMTQNNALNWASNARSNNSDWINQRNSEYAWDAEEERIKQQQANQQWQNSFGGQLMGVVSAAAPIAGAVFGGPAGYAAGTAVSDAAKNMGSNGGNFSLNSGKLGMTDLNFYNNPFANYADGGIPNSGRPAVIMDLGTGKVTGTMNERAPEAIMPLDKMDRAQLAELFAPRKKGAAVYDFSAGAGSKKKVPAYDGYGGESLVNESPEWLKEMYRTEAAKPKWYQNAWNWVKDNLTDKPEQWRASYSASNKGEVLPANFSELSPEQLENLINFEKGKTGTGFLPHPENRDKQLERIAKYYYGVDLKKSFPKDTPPTETGSGNAQDQGAAADAEQEAERRALFSPEATSGYRNPYAGLDYTAADSVKQPEYKREAPRQTQTLLDAFAAAMAAYAPYHTAQMNKYADVGAKSPLEGSAAAIQEYRKTAKAEDKEARQEARQEANDKWTRDWKTYDTQYQTETDRLNREIERIKYDNTLTEKERAERIKEAQFGLDVWKAKAENERKSALPGLPVFDKEFNTWFDEKRGWFKNTNGEEFVKQNQKAIADYLQKSGVQNPTDIQIRAVVKALMKAKP